MSDLSPAAFPLMRTSLGLTATASMSSPLATEMRWILVGLSMIRLLPTVTTSLPGALAGAGSWVLGFSAPPAGAYHSQTDAIRTIAMRSRDTLFDLRSSAEFLFCLGAPGNDLHDEGDLLGRSGTPPGGERRRRNALRCQAGARL